MALIETLTIHVGAAVAKAAAKAWLKDEPFAEAGAVGLVDVLKKKLDDFEGRHSARLIFENVQRDVGRQLKGLLQAEFARTPPEELEAAAIEVAQAFEAASLATIVAADLDPERLRRTIDPGPSSRFAPLGGDAAAAASRMLEASCRYVVTIVGKLPAFHAALGRTLLEREREILEDIGHALQALALLDERGRANDRRDGRGFEPRYRALVVDKLDRMQMFGLAHVGAAARAYPLSVAYVTLTSSSGRDTRSGPVADALGGQAAVVISGEAGSGKTTLMQWLAVRAAGADFTGALAPWNQRLPFYVKLRDHAGELPLPRADQLIERLAPNLVGEMPDGWCQAMLRRGALLLLDGVDELPAARRRAFVDWLADFMRDFGASTAVVVTSRPAALQAAQPLVLGDELAAMGFEAVALNALSPADSQAVVAQWHDAVGRVLTGQAEELARFERDMQHALADRPAIRNLASNPLLCAMVCVLNWHHNRQLPDDRMELYALALDVLLDRREREREIRAVHLARFERKDKEAILDDLAYWMLRNGKLDARRDEAAEQVRLSLQRMGRLQRAQPDEVLQELLERSGVIRQPEAGVVDFIHRTFLEYMGARGALAFGDIDTLARHAADSDWREVVVFACGHAMRTQRDTLVRKLLGLDEPALKDLVARVLGKERPLQADITAACCLETAARDLDPRLLQALQACAARLFPPQDRAMAMRLKPAAESEPSLLRGHAGAGEAAVAACIDVAAAIGGGPMLDVVAEYAAEPGAAVELAIARAWDYFDDQAFLARVIRRRDTLLGVPVASLDDEAAAALQLLLAAGRQPLGRPDELARAIRALKQDHSLSVNDREPRVGEVPDDAARPLRRRSGALLGRLRSLQTLQLTTVDDEVVRVVAALPALRALSLWLPRALDLSPLARMPLLDRLSLYRAGAVQAGTVLASLRIRELTIGIAPLRSLNDLPLPATLESLELTHVDGLDDLGPLQAQRGLLELKLSGSRAPLDSWLHALQALRRLTLVNSRAELRFDGRRLAALEAVRLNDTPLATCLQLMRAPELDDLSISFVPDWPADGRVAIPPTLGALYLHGNPQTMRCLDLAAWPDALALSALSIVGVAHVLNADRLLHWPSLDTVTVWDCENLSLSPAAEAELRRRLPHFSRR